VMAEKLLTEFGSLAHVLAAEWDHIDAVVGGDHIAADFLSLVQATMTYVLRSEVQKRPIFSTLPALIDYVQIAMARVAVEQLTVLFLNAQNELLREEVMGRGGISEAPVYAREIVRRALQIGATALILVHNHPSGNSTPSKQDIIATRRVVEAARVLDISVHDHLIVSTGGTSSFKLLGLL
jgi:DNA repair protein RadC